MRSDENDEDASLNDSTGKNNNKNKSKEKDNPNSYNDEDDEDISPEVDDMFYKNQKNFFQFRKDIVEGNII